MITKQELIDLVTIPNVISWLETKNPKEKYEFVSPSNCAIAQFVKDKAGADRFISVSPYRIIYGELRISYPTELNDAALRSSRTFGGMLKYLKKITAPVRWYQFWRM